MTALIAAILALAGQLIAIVANAITSKTATSAQILADMNAAIATCQQTITALPSVLAADDAKIDAEVASKPATP